ncbi:MAG: hypothetical protein V4617_21830 [Gemmatimonadota bacterium]
MEFFVLLFVAAVGVAAFNRWVLDPLHVKLDRILLRLDELSRQDPR